MPKRVLFEEDALKYPRGQELYRRFRQEPVEIRMVKSHNRVTGIPGKTPSEAYREAKNTLVIGVRRSAKFETCKPSAHYQLPLATSCPGKCEYCYLQTTLGQKPYLRIYVNTGEILEIARGYIEKRLPEVTVFEGAATSDPLALEHFSGALGDTIRFFAGEEYGRFRFVTKFTDVEPLLDIDHRGHTRFRFSVNSPAIIAGYEHATPPLEERITAARKVAGAGYPLGFIIAPVILSDRWKEEYRDMLALMARELAGSWVTPTDGVADTGLTFEIITHRFTKSAKARVLERFPQSSLPMDEEERRLKYGQFGYVKYLYRKDEFDAAKNFFYREIPQFFPGSQIEYFV